MTRPIDAEILFEKVGNIKPKNKSEYELLGKFMNMITNSPTVERPHGECNQCRYYEGVHGVQGHAPCSFWGIGGVLSSDYCSRFEKEGDEK